MTSSIARKQSESGPSISGSPIEFVTSGFDVAQLREILKDPSLWDTNKARTASPDSPHYECHDIWARYAAPSEYGTVGPHESVWYPVVTGGPLKPLLKLANEVMEYVGGKTLGGVLITKIDPGKAVKPHTDAGWHAEHYDKFAVSIEADEHQAFCFHEGSLVTHPGDMFWFYNQKEHWVTNNSTQDRITAIFCIRR
jgi:hypothetical protein